VLHTLNLRLHPDEILYRESCGRPFPDRRRCAAAAYEKFRDRVKFERVIVVPFGGCATPAGCDGYEELLARASEDFAYPQLDENEAAAMCYTSGTTGRRKAWSIRTAPSCCIP
jgi:fatty-acyl-CoA synthase